MDKKLLSDWGLTTIPAPIIFNTEGIHPVFRIFYSAKDMVRLDLDGEEVILEPEHFLLIHPHCCLTVIHPSRTAVLLWFTPELLINYPPRVHYIHENFLFADTHGILVRNEFILYENLRKQYVMPFLEERASQFLRKVAFTNFLEYLLIRVVLVTDPAMQQQVNHTYENEIAVRFQELLRQYDGQQFSIDQYASMLHISKRTLDRAMQIVYGCTAKKWWETFILERARRELAQTDIPVKNLSLELGFSQDSNFINFFKRHTGLSPLQYRQHAGRQHDQQFKDCRKD